MNGEKITLHYTKAIRLSLLVVFTRQTKAFVKCSYLSHKIFALNKGIRLTNVRFKQS